MDRLVTAARRADPCIEIDGHVQNEPPPCARDARVAHRSEPNKALAIVIDSDALIRRAASDLLRRELRFDAVLLAETVGKARAAFDDARASLVLVEAALLRRDPSDDLLQLRADADCPIVVFADDCDGLRAEQWIEDGADGVLDRRVDRAGFCEAMRLAARGERFCHVAEPPPSDLRINAAALERKSYSLRPRQREILRLIASGARNREIALTLGLREPTIKAHVQSTFAHLCVVNRTRAAICANWLIERGLL